MGEDENGVLVPFDFDQLLEKAPLLQSLSLKVTILAYTNPVDSSDITPEHWTELARMIKEHYDNHDGFVILHGTDTMAYTASALSFILRGLTKPVILTGAQVPITKVRTDALENLVTSLEIASTRHADGSMKIQEVCICFNNQLIRGNRAQKVQSNKFDAFNSANYPVMATSGIEIEYNDAYIYKSIGPKELTIVGRWEQNVSVLRLFPGMQPAIIQTQLINEHLKGVVLESFGSGNIPSAHWLLKVLEEAIARDVVVLNVSQCMGGEAVQGKYKVSEKLEDIGVVNGFDLTTEAALTKMMYVLGQNLSLKNTISELITPISGEMTLREH